MELHFQTQTPSSTKRTAFKPRNNNKFIGVRQRPSGRWVAEIKDTTQNIRMWLGTFETAEEAARAYDEAACLLRGSNTRTNFTTVVASDSPVASRIRKMLTHKLHGKKSSASKSITRVYSNVAPTISTGVVPFRENKEGEEEEEGRNDEEVYRPCFIDGSDEYGLCGSMGSGNSWMFDSGFELPAFDMNFFEESSGISETLYAMNGVHEYLDAFDDSSDSFWNLPPLHMS